MELLIKLNGGCCFSLKSEWTAGIKAHGAVLSYTLSFYFNMFEERTFKVMNDLIMKSLLSVALSDDYPKVNC